VRGMSFDWKRVLRKEYGTMYLWYTVVLGLIAEGDVVRFGYEACRVELRVLLVLWGIGAILWGLCRYLKKKGTLGVG
jgi:hypothetical protein